MIQNKIGKMIIVLKKRAGFLQSDSFLQSDGDFMFFNKPFAVQEIHDTQKPW